jgi:acetyltransferase-like isoleucine patch superfamily enzyme
VVIGNHVWVGANVMILKGVHIGEGAVIGANSVVTRDVPDHVFVAGHSRHGL